MPFLVDIFCRIKLLSSAVVETLVRPRIRALQSQQTVQDVEVLPRYRLRETSICLLTRLFDFSNGHFRLSPFVHVAFRQNRSRGFRWGIVGYEEARRIRGNEAHPRE